MSLPLLYAQFPLHERDRFLVDASNRAIDASLNHHVFWHTAYLGLSYLTNPYVPAWRDSVAVEVCAGCRSGCDLWWRGIRSASAVARGRDSFGEITRFVFYTVAAKSGVLACMLLLSINIGLAAAISRPKPRGMELAFWLAMALAALPGIIAIPDASICSRHDNVGSVVTGTTA